MYYPDQHTENIKWILEGDKGEIPKTPKLINDKNPDLAYEQPYYTSENSNFRKLFFKIKNGKGIIDFGYSYSIKNSFIITQLDNYTFSLNYKKMYNPGQFANRKYNYNFEFDSNYEVLESNDVESCTRAKLSNNVNYNCEIPKFKSIDDIQIKFKDLRLEHRFHKIKSTILLALFFIISLIFSIILKSEYNLAPTHIITLTSSITPFILSLIFIDNILYMYFTSIIFLICYMIILLSILSLNEKNKEIRKRIFRF